MATRSSYRPAASLFLLMTSAVAACDGGGTGPEEEEALTEIITAVSIPAAAVNATFHTGDAPSASGGPSITVSNLSAFIPGGTGLVQVQSNQNFSQVIVTMDDHRGHYRLDLPQAVQQTLIGLSLSQELEAENFTLDIAAGSGGAIGAYTGSPLNVLEVGTGEVQVSVSWNTLADVDLHVVEPSGEEIYYGNDISNSGGELDLDSNAGCSADGVNAENITYDDAPSGNYIVRLDYWSSCGVSATNWVVTVRARGRPAETFTGTFTGTGTRGGAGDGQQIATFTF